MRIFKVTDNVSYSFKSRKSSTLTICVILCCTAQGTKHRTQFYDWTLWANDESKTKTYQTGQFCLSASISIWDPSLMLPNSSSLPAVFLLFSPILKTLAENTSSSFLSSSYSFSISNIFEHFFTLLRYIFFTVTTMKSSVWAIIPILKKLNRLYLGLLRENTGIFQPLKIGIVYS